MQVPERAIDGRPLSAIESKGDRRVRIVGKGAREHALFEWAKRSPQVEYVDITPGNGGTAVHNISIPEKDMDAQVADAKARRIDTVIIGPEDPLALGFVDRMNEAGIHAFGPRKDEAQLEADKWFAIQILRAAGVLHPETYAFHDKESAKAYVKKIGYENSVGKEQGLKAGKGVVVWNSLEEADEAIDRVFKDSQLYLIQERIKDATEGSFMAFVDGENIIPLPSARDHKRIGENDTGPNTGGMGAFAPNPDMTPEVNARIMTQAAIPIIQEMKKRGLDFKGILYLGLMFDKNGNMYVTDTNVRGGDPELPVDLTLLEDDVDLIEVVDAVRTGTLQSKHLRFKKNTVVLGIVAASRGYPEKPETGYPIDGLNQELDDNSFIFHAGTKVSGDKTVTNGGRVLLAVGRGKDFVIAKKRATKTVEQIVFEGKQSRGDIGNTVIYQA